MDDVLLNSIQNFSASTLNPTTTIQHHGVQVNSNDAPKVGHDSDDEIKEFFDSVDSTKEQIKKVATLLKEAQHAVVYTGAGISTAAKIPDYRGPSGVWTLRDRGLSSAGAGVAIAQAVPTFAHMAVELLYRKGLVKYVVSTNVDGLHRRSGLPVLGLAELHGNCYKEMCNKCGAEFLRDFDTTSQGCRKDHLTGRNCEKCTEGKLLDSIIHFGENLPEGELNPATENAQKSDFALVLGTSMKVRPACNLPTMCERNRGKLVICNLQKTPYDYRAASVIHAPTDVVMYYLLEELGLLSEIPEVSVGGFPIVKPEAYNPDQLKEKSLQQLSRLSSNNSNNSAPPPRRINVPLNLKQRVTEQVAGKKDEKSEVESNRGQVLFIRDCTNCNFTVKDPSMKIVIENVQSTTVTINATVVTGTCEIISCKDSTIVFNRSVPTITVDKSQGCTLEFAARGQFIWADCRNLKLRVNDQNHVIPEAKDLKSDIDLDITQFRTKWGPGSVQHEMIIREGAGYATTEEEKRVNDEKDRRNEALFAQAMGAITIQPPNPNRPRLGR